MERVPQEQPQQKNKSTEIFALVLIGLGLLWILKQTGAFYHFPGFHIGNVFRPIFHSFHGLGHVIFSWPAILILVGLILMAGKRSAGTILLIIGAIFLLPKLFFFGGATVILFFPVILIVLGIALIARLL